MKEITTVGLDLAKNVFHLIGCNVHGKEVKRKMLKRGQVMAYISNLPACLIGMEACAGAHFWARRFEEVGHEVRLIAPQHVKAYVRGNKNDYNDARAIAEAARRPDMRFVAVKTVEQQDVQALHRLREARVGEREQRCATRYVACWRSMGSYCRRGWVQYASGCRSCSKRPRTA
jgi:transposase